MNISEFPQQFISFKVDFSCIQSKLSQTIFTMQNQIIELSKKTHHIQNNIETQLNGINNKFALIQEKTQLIDRDYKQIGKKLPENLANLSHNLNFEKEPKQFLDDMEKRVRKSIDTNNLKKIQNNQSKPRNQLNQERIQYVIKKVNEEKQELELQQEQDKKQLVKQVEKASPLKVQRDNMKEMDQKFFKIYKQIMERAEKQITEARIDFKKQISDIKDQNKKLYNEMSKSQMLCEDQNQNQLEEQRIQNDQECQKEKFKRIRTQRQIYKKGINISQKLLKRHKSVKIQQDSKVKIQDNQKNSDSFQIYEQLLKNSEKQIKLKIQQLKDRLQEVTKSNCITVDHVVECKKNIQQLSNHTDSLRLEINGVNQRNFTADRQLSLLVQTSNQQKNKFKQLQTVLVRFSQYNQEDKNNDKQQFNEDGANQIKNKNNDMFQDSRSSFRSSITAGLGPLRSSNIIKQNNNRIENIEETLKKLSQKLGIFVERVNKIEDQKKKFGQFQSSLLPKIDKENKSNVNHFEIIKKDIKKINQDLGKTNQRLSNTKQKLTQLYSSHSQIPKKINDLYEKLREYNQIQQDRLIQLIKQLINRMLIDPFDNHFTNTLKRQINYNSILKQIGNKLQGRAEQTQLLKIKQHFQQNIIEVKTLLNKKCETQDFKKGVKYLQGKIKDVFLFTKSETANLYNEQKKYIGVRKQ